jgi:phosphatidylserine/phosphatidylglycerophosphate/cardiolipin synthase-like enzyme
VSDRRDRPTTAHRLRTGLLVGCLLATAITGGLAVDPVAATASTTAESATPASTSVESASPRIVAVYPNPVTDEDRGEFVVVDTAGAANLTLSDGESSVSLPPPANLTRDDSEPPAANDTATGVNTTLVAVSADPEIARNRTDHPVVAGDLALSNAGETLTLRHRNVTLDTATYPDAPEGERWLTTVAGESSDAGGHWRPVGYEPRAVHSYGSANATAFVLPDASGVPSETLRGAEDRLLLAGYTFSSERVADALLDAHERGVEVRVLVDDAPVGGIGGREAEVLDRLSSAGIPVAVIGTDPARFDFHHPKYAVVDDSALVTSENWKPAGTGGNGSRGWGVRIDSPAVADDLAGLFRNDTAGRDTTDWQTERAGESYESENATTGGYPQRFAPTEYRVEQVRVLTAPGNAESAVVGIVDSAEESVEVIQPGIGSRHQPFLRAAIRAADRGVEVRILLSSAWYSEEENQKLVEWLNRIADERGLSLTAKLADPGGRYEKIHTKGLIVDSETVVVGSLNWNNNSARENREVAVALADDETARYYRRTFDADWRGGGSDRLPVGLVAAVALAVVIALLVARREVAFESDSDAGIEGETEIEWP